MYLIGAVVPEDEIVGVLELEMFSDDLENWWTDSKWNVYKGNIDNGGELVSSTIKSTWFDSSVVSKDINDNEIAWS